MTTVAAHTMPVMPHFAGTNEWEASGKAIAGTGHDSDDQAVDAAMHAPRNSFFHRTRHEVRRPVPIFGPPPVQAQSRLIYHRYAQWLAATLPSKKYLKNILKCRHPVRASHPIWALIAPRHISQKNEHLKTTQLSQFHSFPKGPMPSRVHPAQTPRDRRPSRPHGLSACKRPWRFNRRSPWRYLIRHFTRRLRPGRPSRYRTRQRAITAA